MRNNYTWYGFGLFLLSFFPLPPSALTSEGEWVFKKETCGIRIYTREAKDSPIKELKFLTTINSTLRKAIAVLNDVDNYSQWVYKCSESVVLQEIDPFKSYSYYNFDFPWPMSDRDMVIYSELYQDPVTKVVTSCSYGKPEYLPEKEGRVRVPKHFNQWIFKPISPQQIEITYLLKSDPAGNIPSWLINMAIEQGPLKSMKGFINMLQSPDYQNAPTSGIVDFH